MVHILQKQTLVLNITSKWLDFNTSPTYPFEDFALFGQFHSEKFHGPGGVPVSGQDNFVMENVGLSADSTGQINRDKPEFGDLLISYSNLAAQSQSNSGRDGYEVQFSTNIGIVISPGTNYSFPISFRKRVEVVAGRPIYLALSLFRSPSDIPNSNYNNWIANVDPANAGNPYEYNLKYVLPFEYNIIYEPFAANSTTPAQISNWQGIAGFSTNLSLSKPL